jgi:hypothetical protein
LYTVTSSPEAASEEPNPKMVSLPSLRRSISIAEDGNEIFLIPTADELSDDEFDAVWYNSADYAQIKSSCLEMGKRIKSGLPEDETNCYRGLEFLGSKALRQRRSLNRRRAAMSVFMEQEQQWEEECRLPQEEIANAYKSCTRHCQSEAFRRGILDAEIALEVVNENESSSMDMTLVSNSSNACDSPLSKARWISHSPRPTSFPKMQVRFPTRS